MLRAKELFEKYTTAKAAWVNRWWKQAKGSQRIAEVLKVKVHGVDLLYIDTDRKMELRALQCL